MSDFYSNPFDGPERPLDPPEPALPCRGCEGHKPPTDEDCIEALRYGVGCLYDVDGVLALRLAQASMVGDEWTIGLKSWLRDVLAADDDDKEWGPDCRDHAPGPDELDDDTP